MMIASARPTPLRPLIALAALALCWPTAPLADGVSVQSVESLKLDTVAAGDDDTVFRVSAGSGFVTRISGAGQRLGSTSARALVTIACGSDSACDSDNVRISIASLGSSSGRIGRIGAFSISTVTARLVGDSTGSDPTSFTIAPIGANSTAAFYLGGDITISGSASGAPTGAASTAFQVTAGFENTSTNDTVAGSALAIVLRPLAVSTQSPLAFGTIVRPVEGTGLVTIDAATGVRSLSGAGVQALGAGSGNANFAISGEGGQTVSVSVPGTLTLMSGNNTLEVALMTSFDSTTLSGALGEAGEAVLGIGGRVNVEAETPTGSYDGSFVVTVAYN